MAIIEVEPRWVVVRLTEMHELPLVLPQGLPRLEAMLQRGPAGVLGLFGPRITHVPPTVIAQWITRARADVPHPRCIAIVSTNLTVQVAGQVFKQAASVFRPELQVQIFTDEAPARDWMTAALPPSP